MNGTKTDRGLMIALVVALLFNAAVGCFVAYETHGTNLHAADNNRILREKCGAR
jgi:hypothetical protein